MSQRVRFRGLVMIATLIVGGLLGSLIVTKMRHAAIIPMYVSASTTVPVTGLNVPASFAPVVNRDLPAVVNIASTKIVRNNLNPLFSEPVFRQFFGDRLKEPRMKREQNLGSGVIVSSDGHVLTNYHVVEGASQIRVTINSAQDYTAKVIGSDSMSDIAILKIQAKNLPYMVMGDSSKVCVGDIALAMGNPYGLGQTVTMGIVGAVGRAGLGIEDYENFIQTDAAINPGSSGGALVNAKGELIGINTAILTSGTALGGEVGNRGVGFAVPVDMARLVLDQVLRNGKVARGFMGAVIQNLSPELAKMFARPNVQGALLSDIVAKGPSAQAGLQRGDIVVALNGEPVTSGSQFRIRVGMTPPGTTVMLKVLRAGNQMEVPVKLAELPRKKDEPTPLSLPPAPALKGITVEPVTPQLMKDLNFPSETSGVIVSDVQVGTYAADAGLHPGDLIQEINRKPVHSLKDYQTLAAEAKDKAVLLLVNRGGTTLFVAVDGG